MCFFEKNALRKPVACFFVRAEYQLILMADVGKSNILGHFGGKVDLILAEDSLFPFVSLENPLITLLVFH